MRSAIALLLMLLALAVGVAACGKKGDLEPPPGAARTEQDGKKKP